MVDWIFSVSAKSVVFVVLKSYVDVVEFVVGRVSGFGSIIDSSVIIRFSRIVCVSVFGRKDWWQGIACVYCLNLK